MVVEVHNGNSIRRSVRIRRLRIRVTQQLAIRRNSSGTGRMVQNLNRAAAIDRNFPQGRLRPIRRDEEHPFSVWGYQGKVVRRAIAKARGITTVNIDSPDGSTVLTLRNKNDVAAVDRNRWECSPVGRQLLARA